MARILEALSRARPHTPAMAAERPVALTQSVGSSASASTPAPSADTADPMPFIEVGNGPMTASASVLAVGLPVGKGVMPPPPPPASSPREGGIAYSAVSFREVSGEGSTLALPGRLAPALVAYHHPDHASSRQYRALLADILKGLNTPEKEHLGQVLLFSGSCAEAGSTTVVLNLALTQARPQGDQRARRGVVVDAVTRCPGVHRLLGMNASPGLAEVLGGAVPLHRAVRETGVPFCQVLSAGETEKPALAIKSLLATLAHLRKRFELIFVDAPCWTEQPGMVELAAACDALYLVVPQTQASAHATNALIASLPGLGVPLRGCVLAEK